jgi:hypothetical protein
MIREQVFGLPIRAVARVPLLLAFLGALAVWPAVAQDALASATSGMNMVDMTPASMFLMELSSGTSENAPAWPMPMIMSHFESWNTMFMGQGFLIDTQQSGPRGGDKLYSSKLVHGFGGASCRIARSLRGGIHAQPRTRHCHRRTLPGALPIRRDCLWKADR